MYTIFGERTRRRAKAPAKRAKGKGAVPGMITIGNTVRRPAAADAGRKKMTPNQLAVEKLGDALAQYPQTGAGLRRQFKNEFINSEQLRYMNMRTLAGALMFIYELGPVSELIPEYFDDARLNPIMINIMPPIDPKSPPEKVAELRRKHKESLLRYIRYTIIYRLNREQQFRQGIIDNPVEELPPEEDILTNEPSEETATPGAVTEEVTEGTEESEGLLPHESEEINDEPTDGTEGSEETTDLSEETIDQPEEAP